MSVHVDDLKMTGKKQHMAPVWKKLMKNVDLDEPTFLDHVYLGYIQRCSEHVFLLEQLKSYQREKTSRKNSLVVPRHGRTREKMR